MPQGTIGPLVDDEFGRVAVLTMGLTGPGYTAGEIREQARRLRDELLKLGGVERVSLHGVRDEQVQIVLDLPALAAKGISPAGVAQAVAKRNVIAAAGFMEIAGAEIALKVSGDAARPEQLRSTPVPLAGRRPGAAGPDRPHRTRDAGPAADRRLRRRPAGRRGGRVDGPGPERRELCRTDCAARCKALEQTLPAGMALVPITDQAQIVTKQLKQVGQVFLETTAIVMGVVVLFLGLRTGLIVGAIVPTTVLGTLAIMKLLGIDLHIISIGAIIIALGLFVDNAIVVAEDMERRLALGEPREHAAAEAGRTMFVPLLVSSLAIILTFMPLVLSSTETGEYLRSLGIVMAIALLLSLLLAVTFTPLLCQRFAQHHAELSRTAKAVEALTGWYRGKVRWVLGHKTAYIGAMVALLVASGWLFSTVPSELMPASERRQLQMAIELSPDASTSHTLKTAGEISRALADRKAFPEITSQAVYMGDGGPRFILALNPPTPAAHRAYAVLTLAPEATHAAAIERLKTGLAERFPDVRFEPKRFSMGSSDAGTAVFRLSSRDGESHRAAADKLFAALQAEPGIGDVSSDAERQILQLDVQVDQVKAQAAGVSSADIASSLDLMLAGTAVTQYREGDTVLPVVVRGAASLRHSVDQLATLPVLKADGSGSVPLGQVATVRATPQLSVVQRYNQERAVTVQAKHPQLTAQGVADRVAPLLAELRAGGVDVDLGGEIEENASANEAILQLLPACVIAMFLLFVWQFESVRKSLIVLGQHSRSSPSARPSRSR